MEKQLGQTNITIAMDLGFTSAIDCSIKRVTAGKCGLDYVGLERLAEYSARHAAELNGGRNCQVAGKYTSYGSKFEVETPYGQCGSRVHLELFLQGRGWTVDRTGFSGGREKGADAQLQIRALTALVEGSADYLVLIAGDADHLPLVQEAKRRGSKVILITADLPSAPCLDGVNRPQICSHALKEAAHQVIPLDQLFGAPTRWTVGSQLIRRREIPTYRHHG